MTTQTSSSAPTLKTYCVTFTEIIEHVVEVTAHDADEATTLAFNRLDSGSSSTESIAVDDVVEIASV